MTLDAEADNAECAELLACELVTNTVQHATDADWVTVAVSRRGATVHVDVMDDGRAGLPHWREATGEDEGSRGFQLVNEIAQRWGFLRERGRTCIWFELAPGDALPDSESGTFYLIGEVEGSIL